VGTETARGWLHCSRVQAVRHLALSRTPDGGGALEPLAAFTTNPAGSAIVNALGPIRQVVRGEVDVQRRYLVIAPGTAGQPGAPLQIQARDDTPGAVAPK
jgi:hypothetical protein